MRRANRIISAFVVLVIGFSLRTVNAVEAPLQHSLLDIIDKALAVHDYNTVLKYIDKSGVDYFGYAKASRAYVRADILNDSHLYASCNVTVYPSTFRHSLEGAVVTESAEEDTDKVEQSGKRIRTHCRFTITYWNSRPVRLISLSQTVLKVPKSENETAVLSATPMPSITAKDTIVVTQPTSSPIPLPTLTQTSNSTASSTASAAAPATIGFILLGLILFFYFLPAIIGLCNGHPHNAGIFLLNFFLGWSLVGWVVALVWAVSKPQPVSITVNNLALPAVRTPPRRLP